MLTRKRNKIITWEQLSAKRRKNYWRLKKYTRFTFNNWEKLLFFWTPIFIKVNLPTHMFPYILQTFNVYKIPAKEHHLVDRWAADVISVS